MIGFCNVAATVGRVRAASKRLCPKTDVNCTIQVPCLGRNAQPLCTYQCKPRGGGVRARGGDLTKEQKFWSIAHGWGSICSSNVVKIPTQGQSTK